jgi:hypothetical protein
MTMTPLVYLMTIPSYGNYTMYRNSAEVRNGTEIRNCAEVKDWEVRDCVEV